MNAKKIIIIVAGLLVIGLSAWVIYSIKFNTPQQTIKKILEVRNDNDITDEELASFFTESYKGVEKRDRIKLNTTQYNLSDARKTDKGIEVDLSIRLMNTETGKLEDEKAAVFYLKRSGIFPFRFNYKIDYVKEINPVLTLTFPELMPKKEVVEHNFGDTMDIGGHKLRFSDYEIINEPIKDDPEGGVSTYIKFLAEELTADGNLEEISLYLRAESESGDICVNLRKAINEVRDGKAEIKVLSDSKDCQPKLLILKGAFEKDYKININ